MKKILSIVIIVVVLGAIAWYASNAKAPAAPEVPAATDTASAINASLDSVEVADPSADLNALDADINAL